MRIDDKNLWLLLDEDPPGASGIEVRRAIEEGRRRRRKRRVSTVAVTALAAVATAAAPVAIYAWRTGTDSVVSAAATGEATTGPTTAPTTEPPPAPVLPAGPQPDPLAVPPTGCVIERLPTLPGYEMSLVGGGDPTGHYAVGRLYGPDFDRLPAIWHDGQLETVRVPGEDAMLWAVNSSGHAVGSSFAADGGEVAWLYRDGELIQLLGDYAAARAISEAGVIVGSSRQVPVIWDSATAQPRTLPGGSGGAYGIAEDGTIVGTLHGNTDQPVVWYPDGSMHLLPLPEGVSEGAAFHLQAGWAVGRAGTLAARWNVRTGELTTYPELSIIADGATAAGWVIGAGADGYASLVTGDTTLSLPAVTPPGFSLDNIPAAVSEDGLVIAGQSTLDDELSTIVAVRWLCS